MKSQPKKEIERTVTHKGTVDLQRVEREKRLKRREESVEFLMVISDLKTFSIIIA